MSDDLRIQQISYTSDKKPDKKKQVPASQSVSEAGSRGIAGTSSATGSLVSTSVESTSGLVSFDSGDELSAGFD
jgi:hypothetical protein